MSEASSHAAALAAAGWGIRAVRVEPLGGGLINRVWRLETTDGQVWCLKEYAPDLAGEAERTLGIQEWARRRGLPAPEVLPTRDGRLVYRSGPASSHPAAAISRFMPGQSLSPEQMTPTHLAEMGRLLARLHQALAQWPDTAPPQPPAGTVELVAHLNELEALVRNRPFTPDMDDLALSCLQAKREAVQRWHLGPQLYKGAAWQMLHRDFRLDNLLFAPSGEVTGVVDFDFAREGYVAWEVMRAAMTASWNDADGMNPDQAGHVVRAYLRASQGEGGPGAGLDPGQVQGFARLWLDSLVRTTWPLDVAYRQPQDFRPGLAQILRDRDRQTRWFTVHLPDVESWLGRLAAGDIERGGNPVLH
ncbi:MAG: phosphotransferase enzyme family protein [Bacillota bacterium]